MRIRWAGKPPPSAPPDPEVEVDYSEGLWHELTGTSWMHSNGNPAAMIYGMRSGMSGLPTDDKVHYVHIQGMGHLVHESEIIADASAEAAA